MTAIRLPAFVRLRECIAMLIELIRTICARHSVPRQAFDKHTRREGWGLCERAKRGFFGLTGHPEAQGRRDHAQAGGRRSWRLPLAGKAKVSR
jgi:hypothetical protein